MRFTLLAALLLCAGCSLEVGPRGLSVMFAGSIYHHSEPLELPDGSRAIWKTEVRRTWGTTITEFEITPEGEAGSVAGSGMSDNTAGVLGDDLGGKALSTAACALQPAQPGCLP